MLYLMLRTIHLLENNLDKIWIIYYKILPLQIYWKYLSKNPNAINLLEKNQDKIHWYYLSENPPNSL